MKVIVDISDEQRDLFLALMKENNFEFEVDEDVDVPQWQIDEVLKRKKEADADPSILITLDQLKANLARD